ncbi:PAS domain-containing protein, partial [bacterium]|nr:PAS domain-containing protein [bacterium]
MTAGDPTGATFSQMLLAESEPLWRVVLDNSSDHIMRFARGARVEYVNKRLIELTGVPQADWIGKTAAEVMGHPREVAHIWEDDVAQVFDTGEPVSNAVHVDLPAG